jgi:hypothetical protein
MFKNPLGDENGNCGEPFREFYLENHYAAQNF